MPVEKSLNLVPNANVAASIDSINNAVLSIDDSIPPSFRSDPAAYYTAIMQAIATGKLTLSRQQNDALVRLYEKKVPAAPKDINLNATVKVEDVIYSFLQSNGENMQHSLQKARSAEAIEAQYSVLEAEYETTK